MEMSVEARKNCDEFILKFEVVQDKQCSLCCLVDRLLDFVSIYPLFGHF